MNDDIDMRLNALLAPPERDPDEAFTARVARLVLVEEKLRAARRAAWMRAAVAMIATASLLFLFVLLARMAPSDSLGQVPPFSPAAAGLLLLGLWLVVAGPSPEGRRAY